MNDVSAFVKEHRQNLNYTQKEFAHRCGVGLRFLRELEQGKEALRTDKVNQVLFFLGASLAPSKINHRDE